MGGARGRDDGEQLARYDEWSADGNWLISGRWMVRCSVINDARGPVPGGDSPKVAKVLSLTLFLQTVGRQSWSPRVSEVRPRLLVNRGKRHPSSHFPPFGPLETGTPYCFGIFPSIKVLAIKFSDGVCGNRARSVAARRN